MINYIYIIIYSLFILSIHFLSEPKIAYKGNQIAGFSMLLAILINFINIPQHHLYFALICLISGALTGAIFALKIKMQNLPQMIAILNGLGGLSTALIGFTEFNITQSHLFLILFIIILGFITFSGSLASYIKLTHQKIPTDYKIIKIISILIFITIIAGLFHPYKNDNYYVITIATLSLIFGFLFIFPIGGADMPIIISLLNSLSGCGTALVGFSTNNTMLVITGTLIGSSGIILTYIMTKSMNRSLFKVIFKNSNTSLFNNDETSKHFNQGDPKDAAFLMENASKVIIVPGFGMASSNAQHELVALAEILKNKYHVDVKFAIHPVAGRMPGHMNVLLAEADANIENIFELKDINQEFQTTDVVYIVGANDITNPLSKTLKDSPIYQMPILEVELAKKIIFVKRSLSPGYAGIDNPLFYQNKTIMILGDAKQITKQIITNLE